MAPPVVSVPFIGFKSAIVTWRSALLSARDIQRACQLAPFIDLQQDFDRVFDKNEIEEIIHNTVFLDLETGG